MSQHYSAAKNYAHQASVTLGEVSDPGQKAIALSLLAIAEAVLESGYDVGAVRDAVNELGETVGKLEFG